jgi:hypothetical protein
MRSTVSGVLDGLEQILQTRAPARSFSVAFLAADMHDDGWPGGLVQPDWATPVPPSSTLLLLPSYRLLSCTTF